MSDALLRTQLIRLAHEHPEFRKDLLPLLTSKQGGGFPPDSIGEQVKGPEGVPGSDAQKPWSKGEFTQQENVELTDKQEGGQLSDGKADPASKSAGSKTAGVYSAVEVAGLLRQVMQMTRDYHRIPPVSALRDVLDPMLLATYARQVREPEPVSVMASQGKQAMMHAPVEVAALLDSVGTYVRDYRRLPRVQDLLQMAPRDVVVAWVRAGYHQMTSQDLMGAGEGMAEGMPVMASAKTAAMLDQGQVAKAMFDVASFVKLRHRLPRVSELMDMGMDPVLLTAVARQRREVSPLQEE